MAMIQAADGEHVSSEHQSDLYSSFGTSADEGFSGDLKVTMSPPPPPHGSPLKGHFEYSNNNR